MGTDQLREIALRAIDEHAAWKARNAARTARKNFLRAYTDETGERFDRDDCLNGGTYKDVAAFDAVDGPAKNAQRRLASARAATRRAIVRAAAMVRDAAAMPEGGQG